jgi:GT2 family glycosyltransferase
MNLKNMNDSPITFGIGACNNLPYLKLAIHSVRTYSHFKNSPFIIFAENCDKDDTYNWLNQNKDKYNLTVIIENNSEDKTKGIGGGMNECAKRVETEYIMFLHADMFVSKNWDLNCLKVFDKYPIEKLLVNPFRFQPNCWKENDRPGTNFFDYSEFGYKHDNFNEDYFIQYAEEFSKLNQNIEIPKGEGVSGLIRTRDFLNIGGNDIENYRPSFWEDSDIFLRMQLANYKFILTTNSVVFHFGSRSDTSNFPDDNNLIRSNKSKFYEQRSGQNFFKKWGFWPIHNEYGFVTFPPQIDKEKLQHLIKIK